MACTCFYVKCKFCNQHLAGRALTSHKTFIKVVYGKFFSKFSQNFLSKAWLKFFLTGNPFKTLYPSVRSECSSWRVPKNNLLVSNISSYLKMFCSLNQVFNSKSLNPFACKMLVLTMSPDHPVSTRVIISILLILLLQCIFFHFFQIMFWNQKDACFCRTYHGALLHVPFACRQNAKSISLW